MKIVLIVAGKTNVSYIKAGIEEYLGRLKNYCHIELKEIPEIKAAKHLSQDEIKKKEEVLFLSSIDKNDKVILLDEKGKLISSVEFSDFLQKSMLENCKKLVFLIGGPYGFSENLHVRANGKISLSKMTFTHQMVRIIFLEQLYRAYTILNGEPYHHQ